MLLRVTCEVEEQLGFHELEGDRPAVNSLQHIKDLLSDVLRTIEATTTDNSHSAELSTTELQPSLRFHSQSQLKGGGSS